MNINRLKQAEEQQHEVSGEPPLLVMEEDILQFATDHCNKHPRGKGAWNGRQIRNAFLVAASLARHEAEQQQPVGSHGSKRKRPELRGSHFQEVEKLTKEYNRFRTNLLGGDDAHIARLRVERDDDYYCEGEDDDESGRRVGRARLLRIMDEVQQALESTTIRPEGTVKGV